nr:WAP four-disulfide core domain protein 5 [Dasypus novemcinctus]
MRARSLLLLVALLALGSQLPAAWGLRKGEKMGGCPPDDEPCQQGPNQCMHDRQCPSNKKCCYRACFLQCLPRVSVKSGSCPQDQLRCLSPKQHLCHQDLDCPGSKRCCLGACGRDCRDPVRAWMPAARSAIWCVLEDCLSQVRNRNHRLRPPTASLPPPQRARQRSMRPQPRGTEQGREGGGGGDSGSSAALRARGRDEPERGRRLPSLASTETPAPGARKGP